MASIPLLIALGACSTSRSISGVQRHETVPLADHDLVVVVTGRGEDGVEATADIKSALVGRLIGSGLFRDVVSREGDLELRVDLIDVRVVSGAGRVWGGVLARENYIQAHVRLERPSGAVLHECDIEASSGSHPMGASDFRDALDEFAGAVVEFFSEGVDPT